MIPHRPSSWPALLAKFAREARSRPFVWGQWDCCFAASHWIHSLYGSRLTDGLTYDSEAMARTLASENGIAAPGDPFGLWSWVTHLWGADRQMNGCLFAGRGDLVLAEGPTHLLVLGVVVDGLRAAAPGPKGSVYYHRRYWRTAWKV